MLAATLGLAMLIGVSLGLLGGGGSILTVPILTYVAGMDPKNAITASLFVVAVTSAVGVASHARATRVMWQTGLVFGAAGMVGAFVGGRVAALVPARVLMIVFAVMMAVTAVAMMLPRPQLRTDGGRELAVAKVMLQGLAIGIVTGLVGVGGGFVVVPALVLFGGIPMTRAVGTSLLVICMTSVAGFVGHLDHATIDWSITLPVTAVAVGGSLVGGRLAGRVAPASLRRAFGVLVILVAAVVLVQEMRG